jgi:hypothetical protein
MTAPPQESWSRPVSTAVLWWSVTVRSLVLMVLMVPMVLMVRVWLASTTRAKPPGPTMPRRGAPRR